MGAVLGTASRALSRRVETRADNFALDLTRDPDAFIALQREGKRAQELAHPNVITVHDFDRDGPLVFMTMEYLQGKALDAQGRGETVIEPRVHLVPESSDKGHFNVLRGYVKALNYAGVKVVGDFVDNYKVDLPSELAVLNLFDPNTGTTRMCLFMCWKAR